MAVSDELRSAQDLVRIAGKIARLGGWTVDVETGSVTWSDEVCDILEVARGARPMVDDAINFCAPEYRDRIRTVFEACVTQGTPFDEELEIVTAKGHRRWVRSIGEAVRNDGGAIACVQGAFQDITELKRIEAERERLASRLTATLESMTDAFYLLDRDWRFVFVNAEAERILQRKREDLLGRVAWDEFPAARVMELYPAYHRAVREGKSVHLEFFFPPLAEWFAVDAQPRPDGLAVYFRLITQRKRFEAQLRESEERFRIVAQVTADVVWDWNIVQDTVWWNEGMRTLFEYDVSKLPPGIDWWENQVHPEDRARVVKGLQTVIHGSEAQWSDEYRFLRADGSIAQVSDRGFVIRSPDGKAIRMVGSMIDVTERRKLEDQLRQSQRLDAVGQLTGGIAHDFNNLLTVILGNAELLAEHLTANEDQRMLVEMTKTAAERGAELTNRLLSFARRQPLVPRSTDVNRLLSNMDGLLRRTLGEHIEIELVRHDGLWEAMVDPPQLESAVLNLSINARDAMPEGGRLTIETLNVDIGHGHAAGDAELAPGQYVMVSVADTGEGMAAEVSARVFEPFFTTKEVGKGSGLGLSMVYGFVMQSKGHVKIYSEPGQGTTVELYLPRGTGEPAQLEPQSADAPVAGGDEKILLVEDDDLVRGHVSAQLEGLGYRVISVRNGPEALAALRQAEDVELLFTDMVMPGGMNGRQLADEARKLRPKLPVLFTSGYSENTIIHHGRLDPGVHLLQKPYRRQDLAAKMRLAIAQGRAHR